MIYCKRFVFSVEIFILLLIFCFSFTDHIILQHALRLISFRQIHKVLGMDSLPAPKYMQNKRGNPRKRRRTNSTGEGADEGKNK